MVEIDDGFFLGRVALDLGGFEKQNRLAVHQRCAASRDNLRDLAAVRRGHEVFHLHGFEDGDLLARTNHIPLDHPDRDDGALQRRRHRDRSRRAAGRIAGLGSDSRAARSVRAREEQRPRHLPGRTDQRRDMGIDESGADAITDKVGMRQHRLDERNIGGDTRDTEFAQGPRRFLHDIGPARGGRMNDDLRQQGVEGGAGPVSRISKRIDTHSRAGRRIEHPERAAGRLGRALLVHHFHVDAELHGKAARRRDIGLRQAERGQGLFRRRPRAATSRDRRQAPPRSRCARPAAADWPR